ncbi:hypothetical protein Psfp_02338 [Pelotomaculum sp. FP]|nr:hypothetical protein Psfp_02338 [Pelotomaculum sp. FP]
MWNILSGHDLVSIYTLVFLVPFLVAYFVMRLRGWWS